MAIQEATPIVLSADERAALEAWARAPTTEQRLVERAKIVLAAAAGMASRAIAREVGSRRGGRANGGCVSASELWPDSWRAALGQAEDHTDEEPIGASWLRCFEAAACVGFALDPSRAAEPT